MTVHTATVSSHQASELVPSAPVDLVAGTNIGRYAVLEPLGLGGMGVVYKAYDPVLNRTVAVKILLDERACQPSVARLLAEAQVIAQLEHPAIVPIYDIGESWGYLFGITGGF